MPAAIVLQGLFLLTCHGPASASSYKNMCEIQIPNISLHNNFIGIPKPYSTAGWSKLQSGSYEVSGLPVRNCDHTTAACNPFVRGLSTSQLLLAPTVTLSSEKPLIIVAKVPIPDGILGGSQLLASGRKLRGGMAKQALLSPPVGEGPFTSGTYTVSDSLVLYYELGGAFSVKSSDGGSASYSSKSIMPRSVSTNVLVFSSEPYDPGSAPSPGACVKHPRHDANFNALLRYNGKPTTFQLTGDISGKVRGPDAAASYFFDLDLLKPPCTPDSRSLEQTSCGVVIGYEG